MSERPDFDRLGDLLPPEAVGRPPTRQSATPVSGPSGPGAKAASPSEEDAGRRLATVWEDEMGPEIAANARPVQLRGGRLVVTTSSSSWAQTLQNMAPMVVERVNRRLGEETVEKVVFRHAGWDPAWNPGPAETMPQAAARPRKKAQTAESASAGGAPESLSAEESKALAEVDELPLPPGVRQVIRRAMIADFVRGRQELDR